ncbi:MAG: hypothetical protein LBP87_00410 [Planctomycetaceae bacterium]|nr:hypothetical protein [Planctomycetaceae bacterium]
MITNSKGSQCFAETLVGVLADSEPCCRTEMKTISTGAIFRRRNRLPGEHV